MTTTFPRLALLLTVTAAACSPDPLTAPLDPVVAKGGRPGGGATTGIVPIKLGNPKDIGCSGTQVQGVSAGLDPAAPTLAVGFGFCAGMNKPFIWSSTEGLLPTGGSPGQMARAASDNGVVVGGGPNHTPVVFDLSGNVAVDLPMPAGYTWGTANGITPDGRFAVGYGGRGNSSYALRWARSTEGS
ncbi:MAG TPA: hypothetical protein VF862_06140, partial [Gemmatimonadales bacterium]